MRARLLVALLSLASAPALAQPGGNPLAPAPAAKAGLPAPVVTIKSPGAEPRQPLRIKPAVGAKQSVEMVIDMTQETSVGDMNMPKTPVPTITMPMTLEVTAVAPDGDISYSAVFGKPSARGDGQAAAMAAQINEVLAGLENAKGLAVVSSRGVVRDASFQLAGPADETLTDMANQMNQSMKQFSVPFPEEAVGLGAVWTVEYQTELMGVQSSQVGAYTLKELTPAGCALDVQMSQSAPKQEIKNPALPAGMTMTLESISGEGKGTMSVRFDRPMPAAAQISSAIHSVMSMVQNGATQGMKQTMEMTMVMREPAAAPAPANPLAK